MQMSIDVAGKLAHDYADDMRRGSPIATLIERLRSYQERLGNHIVAAFYDDVVRRQVMGTYLCERCGHHAHEHDEDGCTHQSIARDRVTATMQRLNIVLGQLSLAVQRQLDERAKTTSTPGHNEEQLKRLHRMDTCDRIIIEVLAEDKKLNIKKGSGSKNSRARKKPKPKQTALTAYEEV